MPVALPRVGPAPLRASSPAVPFLRGAEALPVLPPARAAGTFGRWRRNARSAAAKRYLASVEGRKFLVTNLVAEIADEQRQIGLRAFEVDAIRAAPTTVHVADDRQDRGGVLRARGHRAEGIEPARRRSTQTAK